MLKILFVAQAELRYELGGPKVVLELADTLKEMGCVVSVVGPDEVRLYLEKKNVKTSSSYSYNLKEFLKYEAANYDIVDYDAGYLPFDRSLFPSETLMVARSVLMILHLRKIAFPRKKDIWTIVKKILTANKYRRYLNRKMNDFSTTLHNADLINVSNYKDVDYLRSQAIAGEIVDIPYGLTKIRMAELNRIAQREKTFSPNIVFVGTYDYRKGGLDIPQIFKYVKEAIPSAKLYLLGAKGLFTKSEDIYSFFPNHLHRDIDIVMTYKSESLSDYLTDMTIGIFPSYLEGFGFAVLEKMAAGIPVFAYDVPGPCCVVEKDYLVQSGNWREIARRVVESLNDKDKLQTMSMKVRERAERFTWDSIAHKTLEVYTEKLAQQRAEATKI